MIHGFHDFGLTINVFFFVYYSLKIIQNMRSHPKGSAIKTNIEFMSLESNETLLRVEVNLKTHIRNMSDVNYIEINK